MVIQLNSQVIWYEKSGEGDPVILLHGNQESHEIFDELAARLSERFTVYALAKTPANVLKESVNSELYYSRIIFTSLADLLRGRESINNLSGPVGIVSAISQAASYGLTDVLEMLVLITVNLGVFNLLPIPALDGGRLVFLAVEAVIRRPVSERVQENLTLATFILLFGLMIFATYNDVIRLFTGAL